MTDTPRVLITRAEDVAGERWDDYARAIERAGGEPMALDCADFTTIEALPRAEGILVTAGIDVDPARYGQPPHERLGRTNPERDRVEGALIRHALETDLPLFAICRGFQLLNVVAGGSLLQHLEEREPHRARRGPDGVSIDSGWHEVAVRLRSTLMAVTGQDFLRVNSRHHQAVLPSTLGEGLVATAMAPDGVVEAIEAFDRRWVLGVQWHPERPEMRSADDPLLQAASTALFDAFVEACRLTPDTQALSAHDAGTPAGPFLYFAYGGNLNAERLRQHAPGAHLVSIARLPEHRLAFSIESKHTWHGGVCDVLPDPASEVWGALWLLPPEASHALDDAEGVFRNPPAYRRIEVTVITPAGDRVTCRSYQVATPDPAGFAPSPAFKRALIEGARDLGLPAAYVAHLEAVPDNGYGAERGNAEAAPNV